MSYLNYYHRGKAIPMIIELLEKEKIVITDYNIKSWPQETMRISDVLNGINHVKSNGGKTIVYTNTVPLKEKLSIDHEIKILDIEDLKSLSSKHGMYDLYDLLY